MLCAEKSDWLNPLGGSNPKPLRCTIWLLSAARRTKYSTEDFSECIVGPTWYSRFGRRVSSQLRTRKMILVARLANLNPPNLVALTTEWQGGPPGKA